MDMKLPYNRDICHCNGIGCPIAETCRRYELHRYSILHSKMRVTYVEPAYSTKEGSCYNLWELPK